MTTPIFAPAGERPNRARQAMIALLTALLVTLPVGMALAQNLDTEFTKSGEPRDKIGEVHIHGGVYMPVNKSQASAALGARFSGLVTPQLSMGLTLDWYFSASRTLGAAGQPLPSSVYTPQEVLGNAVTQLFPLMAFMQLAPWPKAHLSPYAGIGAGYEWLHSSANDFQSNYSFDARYSNWAWQTWAGMGIRLSRELRLDGEAYFNAGVLGRDVHDANGDLAREVVTVNGAGIRCGLNLAY